MKNPMFLPLVACVFLVSNALAVDWDNFKGEDYEEPAGASFQLLANTQDNIYGAAFGDGTWLKNTPVFGDFALSLFSNGIEDSFYSGISMTIRLMPHWRFAPFAGGGGSYNYSFSQSSEDDGTTSDIKEFKDQGESYWGYHAEAGIRVHTPQGRMLFELMARNVWTSLEGDRR